MNGAILVDTGPLVAFLTAEDQHHQWACDQFRLLRPPLLTCEAVLSEASHLLERTRQGDGGLLELLATGVVEIAFRLGEQIDEVWRLKKRYRNVPMSLADACLVRMTEIQERATVFTTDSDFQIYRKHGRYRLALLLPRP